VRHVASLSLLVLALAASGSAAAVDLEFHGYARAGVGLSAAGGGQVCFGLAGADTKYRLGNECDYTLEPTFIGRFVALDDGSRWGVVLMPSLYRTYSALDSFDNLPVRFGQIYLFGEEVPALLHGSIWGGRRFYDRLHIGINDHFLEIEDGDGAGVEAMNLGFGRLSVAFLMNPNDEAHTYRPSAQDEAVPTNFLRTYRITTRLTDIPTFEGGALQIWGGFYASSLADDAPESVAEPDDMYRLALYHTVDFQGGSILVGGKLELGENHQLWRVVLEHGFTFTLARTGVDLITEFRSARNRANEDADWVTQNWFTIGARTDTHVAGPFRFLVEGGHDYVSRDEGDAQQLTKVTGALAVSAGTEPWSRPTFRLFYTHAFWNEAAKEAGGVYDHAQSGDRLREVYGDANHGGTFGIQAEAWW
jgi:maltoporin